MKSRLNAYSIFFLIFFFLFPNLEAQKYKGADSLLLVAMKSIYNEPQKSLKIGNELLPQSKNHPDFQIRLYMMMAQASVMLPDYEKSLEYANKALVISRKNNDYNNQILVNNFLGTHYLRLNLKEKAWRALEETEKIIAEHPLPDSSRHLLGNVYMLHAYLVEDDDCKTARHYFDKAVQAFSKSDNEDFSEINIGLAYTHKGRCYLKEEEIDSAKLSFYKAIRVAENIHNEGTAAFAYLSLGNAYNTEKNYQKSNETLFEALEIASRSSQTELIKEAYKGLAENYFQLNDLVNYAKYDSLYKITLNEFNQSEINSVQKIAKSVKSERNEPQNYTKYIIVFSVILVLLVVFFFLRSYKLKRKMK